MSRSDLMSFKIPCPLAWRGFERKRLLKQYLFFSGYANASKNTHDVQDKTIIVSDYYTALLRICQL